MQYLARRLRESGYVVQSPAIPGCGFGTREDPFDTGSWREWTAYVLGQLDAMAQRYEKVHVAGLCIGAVLALRLAIERPAAIGSLSLISTTLYYDGWAMPWYRFLIPLGYYTPLRRRIAWRERSPFGLKNERMREWIERAMASHGNSPAGAAALPLMGIHEAHALIRAVRRDIKRVVAPTLLLHAREDEVASPRSAEFVAQNVGSGEVRKVLFDDSYHMLTLDNDKDAVVDETLAFFERHGAAARRAGGRGEAPVVRVPAVAG